MAAGVPTVTEHTVAVTSDQSGTLLALTGTTTATEMVVGVFVKSFPAESGFRLTGVTLPGTADGEPSVRYYCKGPGTVTYNVVLTVSKVSTA